jgi:hypothetical protein
LAFLLITVHTPRSNGYKIDGTKLVVPDGTRWYHGTIIMWDRYQNNVGPIPPIYLIETIKNG